MSTWIWYAIGTAIFLAAADVFVKIASNRISSSYALLIFGTITFLIALAWVVWERRQGTMQFVESGGIAAAAAVGLAFTSVTIGLYLTYAAGAPISVATPMIRLSGLLLASLIGIAAFSEPLTARYGLGIVLAICGIVLIAAR